MGLDQYKFNKRGIMKVDSSNCRVCGHKSVSHVLGTDNVYDPAFCYECTTEEGRKHRFV